MSKEITYIYADDDELQRELTLEQLSLISGIKNIAVCCNALEARASIDALEPDFAILDIEMPGLSGLDMIQSLRRPPLVIFVTSYTGFAIKAFDMDAVDYIVKPMQTARLLRAIDKVKSLLSLRYQEGAIESISRQDNDTFFIKEKNSFTKINFKDVLYIESTGNFSKLYLIDKTEKLILVGLSQIEAQLPMQTFIRISRQHIVNKEKITALNTEALYLAQLLLPIGKSFAEAVIQSVVGNNSIKRLIK